MRRDARLHARRRFVAEQCASQVIEVETAFAAANLPGDAIRDPYAVYNKVGPCRLPVPCGQQTFPLGGQIDLLGLKLLTPMMPWDDYLVAIGAPTLTSLNVGEPAFFKAVNLAVSNLAVTALDSYVCVAARRRSRVCTAEWRPQLQQVVPAACQRQPAALGVCQRHLCVLQHRALGASHCSVRAVAR